MVTEQKLKPTRLAGDRALLPGGLRDQLAPLAEFEADVVNKLNAAFASFGYDRVAPPLLEFEETLLQGPGQKNGDKMFRLMDPDTQRVMALRADMTIQIARIAETRLGDAARPLRLAYSGHVVRVKGSQVRPSRQFMQAGVELIGSNSLAAEKEVISLAIEALTDLGVDDLTIDLTVAPMISMVTDSLNLTGEALETAVTALDKKDVGALDQFGDKAKEVLSGILLAAGPASDGLAKLRGLNLSGAAGQLVARLGRLVDELYEDHPGVKLTIDPGETHGFEYKSGIGFALFSPGVRGELGRGGRYMARTSDGGDEPATGFSIYLDTILRALEAPSPRDKIYIPFDIEGDAARKLRKKGYRTVQGLTQADDSRQEALRLKCSHYFLDGKVTPTT